MSGLRVGVVGNGRMGNAYALNLLKAGYDVRVYDADPAASRNLIERGAVWGKNPAEIAANVEFFITSLPRNEIVEEVLVGRDGAVHHLQAGSIAIDMSTTLPRTTKRIAEAITAAGSDFLDAPVSGHAIGATNATLTIMVGGPKEAFLRSKEPIFAKLGKNIFHAGPSGAGQALKLVNNLLYNINRLAMCEGLVMGTKAGIDPEVLCQAVSLSTGASRAMTTVSPDILRGDFAGRESSLNLACKTLKLISDFADELQVPLFLGNVARQIYTLVKMQGHGDDNPASAITLYEKAANVQVRAGEKK